MYTNQIMADSLTFATKDSKMGMNGTLLKYLKFEIYCLVYIPSQVVTGQDAQYNSSEVNSNIIQNTMSAE